MEFEKHLSMTADHEHVRCPNGHSHPQRIYTAPRINFKGSGFYVTDSRNHSSVQSSS
jgi:predicted nucleic acid-binding Zn ribbon protein